MKLVTLHILHTLLDLSSLFYACDALDGTKAVLRAKGRQIKLVVKERMSSYTHSQACASNIFIDGANTEGVAMVSIDARIAYVAIACKEGVARA